MDHGEVRAARPPGGRPRGPRGEGVATPDLIAIADEFREGVIVLAADGTVLFANRSARALIGGERPSRAPASIDEIPFDAETGRRLRRSREPWGGEAALETVSGPAAVRIAVRPIRWEGSEAATLLVLSERGDIEEAIADRDRARRNDLSKTRSLHMAAHDLSGPLTVLNGYISLVAEGSLEVGDLAPLIPVLSKQLSQMQRVIQVLLDTARLEEGRLEIAPVPLELGEFVAGLVEDLQVPMESGHRFEVVEFGDALPVLADPARLVSIARILLMNAVNYSSEASLISCRLSRRDGSAVLEVIDRGAGIEPGDLPRLFSRFGQVGHPEQSAPGTGLGLHLSRELARLHGGDITVASQVGVGSTFTLTLPLHEG